MPTSRSGANVTAVANLHRAAREAARVTLLLLLMITAMHAENVLLVVGTPTLSAGDTALRNRLQALGHIVTVKHKCT